ncbi:hypothetical protein KIN20_005528 [Parelaphostrongylus tenuis]|uniref:Uncharacterized protein n=1 Tax=Parelaphostrongylus tenuis TaxID=148309 RepID=A0AAD5M3D5_PARTN|nr:hypothetical protein KIN20_005528 [Parelaphostrongylus tenuis]
MSKGNLNGFDAPMLICNCLHYVGRQGVESFGILDAKGLGRNEDDKKFRIRDHEV